MTSGEDTTGDVRTETLTDFIEDWYDRTVDPDHSWAARDLAEAIVEWQASRGAAEAEGLTTQLQTAQFLQSNAEHDLNLAAQDRDAARAAIWKVLALTGDVGPEARRILSLVI